MNAIFFESSSKLYLLESKKELSPSDLERIAWALEASLSKQTVFKGPFIGPRSEMVTPWSTNACDIVANMGVEGVSRLEEFRRVSETEPLVYDALLEQSYAELNADSLRSRREPEAQEFVKDIAGFNNKHGLALSKVELEYLEKASAQLGRDFTDSEIYGFAQINSEHCRHKIFNGEFVVDGAAQPKTLFQLIKDTSKNAPQELLSAYKDNVAFVKGPRVSQFAPNAERVFNLEDVDAAISLKAETHNFPTTVEPFYGASTGSGGEIRDRMAGGCGSLPLVGTAVYMSSYSRLSESRSANWEKHFKERKWKYQTPAQILLKASNGASDFGNKYGQPLIVGSLLTAETKSPRGFYAYDRAVMLAGGVGYANLRDVAKKEPRAGDKIVLLGGDNYRIGMAGSSVSSVDTGKYGKSVELSAVQRANPEMQKRVFNVIRSLVESAENPIRSIHDHGAGGHMNCFAELVEPLGGRIYLDKLPVGDPTLSARELLSNESQERMGLIIAAEHIALVEEIARRERAPFYVVGEITGDGKLEFKATKAPDPVDLPLSVLLGSSPKTLLEDSLEPCEFAPLEYVINSGADLLNHIENVLSLEAVACKEWLTNKVDRSVTGRVALQQTCGPLQLPLNNLGVVALDYLGQGGIASSLAHAPLAGIIDEKAGSLLSVIEALTNIVWAPLSRGLSSVTLSANWMWPAKQPGEDARLYSAVKALSDCCLALGIAVPTGKDSLSMTMGYDDFKVKAPGTVVVTAVAECDDVRRIVTPDLKPVPGSKLVYVNLSGDRTSALGGSSFAQTLGQLGQTVPQVDLSLFAKGFAVLQDLLRSSSILAGHDVSSGGLITTLLEMCFTGDVGCSLKFSKDGKELLSYLFSENPGVVLQLANKDYETVVSRLRAAGLMVDTIGELGGKMIECHAGELSWKRSVSELRRVWFRQSYLYDCQQTSKELAASKLEHLDNRTIHYKFPSNFDGSISGSGVNLGKRPSNAPRAAVVREQGTNGERELAFALFAAGFQVKDVSMTDLISGAETLEDVQMLAFAGGFSYSDVMGSARGWAGSFKFNAAAMNALQNFYARPDTLSVGVCNGCQLLTALDLIYPEHAEHPRMLHNDSGKFESHFLEVRVQETNSVFLKPLVGASLGIWVAHGEGRFHFPYQEARYDIPLRYASANYPQNPNGSAFNAAAISSLDGRHLALMPHLERALFSWTWAYKSDAFKETDEYSPWILSFLEARKWLKA